MVIHSRRLWTAFSRARRNAQVIAILFRHFLSVRSTEDQMHSLDQSVWNRSRTLNISTLLWPNFPFRHRHEYLQVTRLEGFDSAMSTQHNRLDQKRPGFKARRYRTEITSLLTGLPDSGTHLYLRRVGGPSRFHSSARPQAHVLSSDWKQSTRPQSMPFIEPLSNARFQHEVHEHVSIGQGPPPARLVLGDASEAQSSCVDPVMIENAVVPANNEIVPACHECLSCSELVAMKSTMRQSPPSIP